MKCVVSAIAIGATLACACHVASAQSSVTVTQQGDGNTSSTEQVINPALATQAPLAFAVISQIGTNNHAGGPGATSSGIYQRDNFATYALIQQNGAGNNAGITQEFTRGYSPVEGRMTQLGNGNSATVKQYIVTSSTAAVDQTGTGNVARVEQIESGDTRLQAVQNGNANQVTIVQRGGTYGGPGVTQNGDGNTASMISNNSAGYGSTIVQNGTFNSASIVQNINGFDSTIAIQQLGTGNRAGATQTGEFQSALIDQIGNDNLASVTQTGLPGGTSGNRASIAQLGDSNTALVRQLGQGYVANVSQIGSGNYTNIYQH
ncbi:MAG: hypothetical protein ABIT83_06380 [Massilia sp.]